MELRRLNTLLLACAGVLVGHLVGYAAARPNEANRELALGVHNYIGPLATVLVPLGLLAMLGTAIRSVRSHRAAQPIARQLATAQVGLFIALELFERVPGSGSPAGVLSDRAVWFGVAAQVAIAYLVVWMVRFTATVVARVLRPARRRVTQLTVGVVELVDRIVNAHEVSDRLPRRRGPPSVRALVLT